MNGRRFWTAFSFGLALALGGCSSTIGVYHDVEGGAIAQGPQPPPGMDQPYPNLADVPAAPAATPVGEQAALATQARIGVSAPSPGALAGLSLPAGPPPLPDVPGVNIPEAPAPDIAALPAPSAPAAPPPPGPPIPVGFDPGSAILPATEISQINKFASTRGSATIIAGGFGDGSLWLGVSRARRLADALTADGVPGSEIQIAAAAAGSGGFVRLVY